MSWTVAGQQGTCAGGLESQSSDLRQRNVTRSHRKCHSCWRSFKAVCCAQHHTFPCSVEACHGCDLSSISSFICKWMHKWISEPSENTFSQISGLSLNDEMKAEPHQSAGSEDIWHNLRLPLSLKVLCESRKYAVLLWTSSPLVNPLVRCRYSLHPHQSLVNRLKRVWHRSMALC